jgi:hypothetical protein
VPPPPPPPPPRAIAVAAVNMGRTKNKKVKRVATRANMFTEDYWGLEDLLELLD